MKAIHSIQWAAQYICDDPEAVDRGYLDEQTLVDAERLAQEAIKIKLDVEGIGDPHQWWEANCPVYAELANSPSYSKAKRFRMLLDCANYLAMPD